MSWADAAAPVVAEVIRNVGRSDMKALRKALVDAYPWGERTHSLQGLAKRDSPSAGSSAECSEGRPKEQAS